MHALLEKTVAILGHEFAWCPIPESRIRLHGVEPLVAVSAFHIAKYPLTNAQYDAFFKCDGERGFANPIWWDFCPEAQQCRRDRNRNDFAWETLKERAVGDAAKFPTRHHKWYDAIAFCRWLTARLYDQEGPVERPDEGCIAPPTEAQWQCAALGEKRAGWPWGMTFDSQRANIGEMQRYTTVEVDKYPKGASPFGVMDMIGNEAEWCLNEFDSPAVAPRDVNLQSDRLRAHRGGHFTLSRHHARPTQRGEPANPRNPYGFRIAFNR